MLVFIHHTYCNPLAIYKGARLAPSSGPHLQVQGWGLGRIAVTLQGGWHRTAHSTTNRQEQSQVEGEQ